MSNQLVISPNKGALSSKKVIEFIDKMQLNKIILQLKFIHTKQTFLDYDFLKEIPSIRGHTSSRGW